METYKELLSYFPDYMAPRPAQERILKKIAEGLDIGKTKIMLDAGTGIGKSAIAVTMAKYLESAYIVTVTKQLQDQYHEDFVFPVLKGRNNFNCKDLSIIPTKCDDGSCQVIDAYECDNGITLSQKSGVEPAFKNRRGNTVYYRGFDHCNYWEQKAEVIKSPIALLNYASFFLEMNFGPYLGKRELSVFDEVHNLEDQIMSRISLFINKKRLAYDFDEYVRHGYGYPPKIVMGNIDDQNHWLVIINDLIEKYGELEDVVEIEKKKQTNLNRMLSKLKMIEEELRLHFDEWVIETVSDNKNFTISFKPIDVARYCNDYFFKHSHISLMMSATILDKEGFCRWHGLNEDQVCYIHEKSPFNPEKRPIHLNTVGSMAYKNINKTKPKTIPAIKDILKTHVSDKGLIHTHNHKLTQYLIDELNDPRLISYTNTDKNSRNKPIRENVIQKLVDSENPLVLVAPSVDEGIDLPDDLCRFQIIYKVPYPDMGNKQIKARMKKDPDWYAYKTVISLVQAYGRGMRHNDDYCITYITDSDINKVLKDRWRRCIKFIPEYFLEAINQVS
jgi:ATP-dependent DNA helicase DinG